MTPITQEAEAEAQLQLYLLTFNCARNLVDPHLLGRHFFSALTASAALPDVIVVSLQEVAPIAYSFLAGAYLLPYFDRIAASLRIAAHQHGGASDDGHVYRLVLQSNLGMTGIMLFAKPEVADRIRSIRTAGTGVGLWGMGNKGAVGVRIALAPTIDSEQEVQFTFIAAHLAPMEDAVARRNEDWENIVRNLVFEPLNGQADVRPVGSKPLDGEGSEEEQQSLISSSGSEVSQGLYSPNSHVFFAGDLNYRSRDIWPSPADHHSFPQPVSESDARHYSHLLATDQLQRELQAGRTLHGFHEQPITFPPTYKYSFRRPPPGEAEVDRWTWARHRWPSWCDRILFIPDAPSSSSSSSSSTTLQPQIYTSLPVLPSSDHQAVALSLTVPFRPVQAPEDDVRRRPPFPLNPAWKEDRAAARRLEIAVGVLSYLTLTWEGRIALAAVVLGTLGVAGVLKSFLAV